MATYTSAASGLWSAGATWVGGVKPPSGAGHKIVVNTGHIVEFDEVSGTYGDDTSSATMGNNAFVIYGTLYFSRTRTVTLTVRGSMVIGTAGTIDCGTLADPIQAAYTVTLIQNDSATIAAGKHGLMMLSSSNTKFYMRGVQRTRNTTLTAPVTAGTNPTIVVADADEWAVGDRVCLASDTWDHTRGQVFVVSAISGLSVTLTGTLTYSRSAGCEVGNLSSNVIVKAMSANYPGVFRTLITADGNFDVGDIRIENMGSTNGWTSGSSTTPDNSAAFGIGSSTTFLLDTYIERIAVEQTGNGGTYAAARYSVSLGRTIFKDWAVYIPNTGNGFYMGDSCVCDVDDCVVYRCTGNAINTGYGAGAGSVNINRGAYWCLSGCGTSGLNITMNSVKIRTSTSVATTNALSGLVFNNCDLYALDRVWGPGNPGALFGATFQNCAFNGTTLGRGSSTIRPSIDAMCRVYQPENTADDYRAFNWHFYGQTDGSVIHRGPTSFRMKPEQAGIPFAYKFTLPAVAGLARRYIGYLRFDANYGTATPPVIAFEGSGVSYSFTAPATADDWHKFDATLTPTASGEITVTLTGQSAATNGYAWVDGITFYPFIQSSRHYGFTFNVNPFRAADTNITESDESVVAAYASIDSLDALYDRIKLWACENQTSAEFMTASGSDLDLGSYNLVVDATAAQAFGVSGSTVTVKSSALLAGSKFSKVITSGSISAVNGAIIDAVYQDSTGTSAKLIINLPLSGMGVCVHDGAGADVDCLGGQSGTYVLRIAPGATGTWTWVINKQGYVFAIADFTPGSGGIFEYTPSCPQVTTPDGTPMYQGTTSALVQVTFAGGYAYIDIGDGTPPLQAIYDMTEDALATDTGLEWLIDGGDGVSVFNSGAGDFLFMTGGWRLRRWHAGDSNATVPAFAQSVDGTPVDEVNGPVRYLTSDSPTAIAAAVLAAVVEGSTSVAQSLRLMNALAGGKVSGHPKSPRFRDLADTKDRIAATLDDAGNRDAVALDLTP